MLKMKDLFVSSLKEFKNVRSIALAAMLGAIAVILNLFSLQIGNFIKYSFTFLPYEFTYYLFGPVFGAIFGAVMDILNFIVKPTGPFFPGFTLNEILNGLLFGALLYKRPVSLKRITVASTIQLIFINLILKTYWLSIMFGSGFFIVLAGRAWKELLMFPVNIALLYMVSKGIEASKVLNVFRGSNVKA